MEEEVKDVVTEVCTLPSPPVSTLPSFLLSPLPELALTEMWGPGQRTGAQLGPNHLPVRERNRRQSDCPQEV